MEDLERVEIGESQNIGSTAWPGPESPGHVHWGNWRGACISLVASVRWGLGNSWRCPSYSRAPGTTSRMSRSQGASSVAAIRNPSTRNWRLVTNLGVVASCYSTRNIRIFQRQERGGTVQAGESDRGLGDLRHDSQRTGECTVQASMPSSGASVVVL